MVLLSEPKTSQAATRLLNFLTSHYCRPISLKANLKAITLSTRAVSIILGQNKHRYWTKKALNRTYLLML